MLKIKDDVDLKELEKYGFYKSGYVWQIDLQVEWLRQKPLGIILSSIYVREEDRIIRISQNEDVEIIDMDVLYDLIQAGLVEKVGDE